MNQNQTPILEAIEAFTEKNPAYFNIPGHRMERGISTRWTDRVGKEIFSYDLTEASGLDDLHHPQGAILKAQQLAAEVFGARKSFFLVNGTTCGNEAMVLSCAGEGEKLLVPRNVHKSVMMGMILSGARPVYVMPEYSDNRGIWGSLKPETVYRAFEKEPDIRGLLLVSPTYYGVCSDLKALAQICHTHGAMLLVDEAHGAHLYFSDKLPKGALQLGADLCAQSIHKVTGSLTQSSMLHIGSTLADEGRVRANLQLVQSTSPSYLLMASLDAARYELALHGSEMINRAADLAERARAAIRKLKGISCIEQGEEKEIFSELDITRLTFSAKELGISGFELQELLFERFGVSTELADYENVLAVLTYANTNEDIDRLVKALSVIAEEGDTGRTCIRPLPLPGIPPMELTPREAYFRTKRSVPWKDAVGKIAAEMLCPYPPGIPLIYPGEIVTQQIWDYMERYRREGHPFHGPADERLEWFQIVDL